MASKKKNLLFSIIGIAVILTLCGSFLYYNKFSPRAAFRKDLKKLSQESYNSVFLSMHSSAGYTKENFLTYSALDTFVSSYEIRSMEELQRYLERVFSSANEVSNAFLLLDPVMIRNSCGQNASEWDAALQNGLFVFADAHPDTYFQILLPYPSLAYWVDMEQTAVDAALTDYGKFVEDAYEYANIRTYYMGFENWLLVNPENYISDFEANDVVTKKIYLSCFCDNINQITPINGGILFDMFREQVIAERTSPAVYPDLSDRCFIFFGDSIMAAGEGTVTTPGYVAGLSHAAAYNYAVGGTTAGHFPNAMSRFLSEECVKEKDGTYRFAPEGRDLSDKKLYFFLLYGANDYFGGNAVDNPDDPYDPATYAGSLRNSLREYMPLFPDAQFIIMTPNYTNYFSNGTERMSDVGGVLTEYVEAAISVAEEFGIPAVDNYHGLGIDDSNLMHYTADGCHPNENGRVLMAKRLIAFIDDLSSSDLAVQ